MSVPQNIQVGTVIPNSYIVVLRAGSSIQSFHANLQDTCRTLGGLPNDAQIHKTYTVIHGFHAMLTPGVLQRVKDHPDVAYVEQDKVFSIIPPPGSLNLMVRQPDAPWGLIRISQRESDLTQLYNFPEAAGEGVTAYVIDTGVYTDHEDFQGRASWGHNFVTESEDTDENGHGTHVAGTISGAKYGVAKKVKIVAVKVMDANGRGLTSGIIAGVDWVVQNAIPGKSVANMSLGGGQSNALNDAVTRLYDNNIPVFVAAGNDSNTSADEQSPASSPGAYTVVSMNRDDHPSSFNSYGTCVDIFAPGEDIISAWIGSPTATNTISGTSMATPHVTGIAAIYLSLDQNLLMTKDVYGRLTDYATGGALHGDLQGMKNLIVFNNPT